MTKRVIVGEPFDGTTTDVEDNNAAQKAAEVEVHESRARTNIAYGTSAVGVACMAVAGTVGIYDGSFDELSNVWVAFGPISGAIVGYYFGGKSTKSK
ncbi:hypothetical protein [uncultured Roseovarius sp.]|uniref:hypothetical protein n=1 Tax=uncultured Roseovarius sp. TaxID=293344 RepID=UPI002615602B|nr:hypothetical protein [uncultured Roseovarius sp.]